MKSASLESSPWACRWIWRVPRLHLGGRLGDDRLHVLSVPTERVLGDGAATGDGLQLLAAQPGLVHRVAAMMADRKRNSLSLRCNSSVFPEEKQ